MLQRQIRLARKIVGWVFDHPAYEVLPGASNKEDVLEQTYMSILFSAKDDALNQRLASTINATSRIYVSGTSWQGRSACRIAISNWRVDVERDFTIVTDVLESVAKGQ